ncbi:MAG: DUF2070 family protein [Candidatus Bathyarchaeota archaeon]
MAENKKIYMTKAIGHYNKLFTFPNYSTLLLLLLIFNIGGTIMAFTIIHPDLEGIIHGIIFAFQVLFLPITIVDAISRGIITKDDRIFDLKRSTSLSLVICTLWIIIMNIGSGLQLFFQTSQLLYYATFFSICTTVAMRFLVLSTVTQMPYPRLIMATITQPVVLFVSSTIFWWNSWSPQIIVASIISSTILIVATQLLVHLANKQGEVFVGIGTILLFKGFLANWLEGLNYPLEGYFEKLGADADVSINLFSFRSMNKLKAMIVIPNLHPGPFKNLGSSNLPDMIQRAVEEKFAIITAVPHGLSGHELDLTSQPQCDRVVREILKANISGFSASVSKLVRVDTGLAKATCQFFGETALIAVTCAPKSMEDIPLKIGENIMQRGKQLGAKQVVIIDAHNSIGNLKEVSSLSEEEEQELVSAAEKALRSGLKEEQQPFLVGAAKIVPEEFSISQGMGPGGIVTLAVIVGEQKTLYVTIDGNNMVSGLREDIIQALSTSFDECEVLTTDTHIVNAVNTIKRGYYPVGEAIDHEQLLSYIKDVAAKAVDNAEKAEVSFTRISVNNVRVIGEEKLVTLSMLIDRTFSLMKWAAPLIFIPAIIAAILPFLL